MGGGVLVWAMMTTVVEAGIAHTLITGYGLQDGGHDDEDARHLWGGCVCCFETMNGACDLF